MKTQDIVVIVVTEDELLYTEVERGKLKVVLEEYEEKLSNRSAATKNLILNEHTENYDVIVIDEIKRIEFITADKKYILYRIGNKEFEKREVL